MDGKFDVDLFLTNVKPIEFSLGVKFNNNGKSKKNIYNSQKMFILRYSEKV